MRKAIAVVVFGLVASGLLFASGSMDGFGAADRDAMLAALGRADRVVVYEFWSGAIDGDYDDQTPSFVMTDRASIDTVIDSISFDAVRIAECGFDFTLLFFDGDEPVLEAPLRINVACNNLRFRWGGASYISGIDNGDELLELLQSGR